MSLTLIMLTCFNLLLCCLGYILQLFVFILVSMLVCVGPCLCLMQHSIVLHVTLHQPSQTYT